MFDQLFPGAELPRFLADHFSRKPYARPGQGSTIAQLLNWRLLEQLLGSDSPVDVLTVRAGCLFESTPPRSIGDVMELMRCGVSTVLRAAERHSTVMAALADSFAQVLGGQVHVQIYATPAHTHSYGWHYDFEDVFVIQALGTKDYYFRENTVARETRLGDGLDFEVVREERSQLLMAQLIPGDWLHIPRRWWHLVKCRTDSLSISVGVMPLEALQTARHVPAGWDPP